VLSTCIRFSISSFHPTNNIFKMKYSIIYLAALTSMSNAVPVAQLSGFSIPSFPGFSMPSFPGRPTATNTAGAGGSISALPTSVKATATGIAQPTQTGSTGGSIVGGNCTPQGNGGGSTENGVKDKDKNNYCCTDVTVIFARGTGEVGNMGTVTGPPMVKSLRAKLGAGRVTVQGVEYLASGSVSYFPLD
jgi:cutinase